MFTTYCPRHGAEVLIWASGIDGIDNTDHGIEIHFHCTCGYRGVHLTGRAHAAV
jgi:hypothetical protein